MTTYDPATEVPVDIEAEVQSENHVDVIETVISGLDQGNTALVNRTLEGHIWKFKYGSVDVFVQLTGETDDDTFTVWSPILTLPVQNEAGLTRKLLEMNWLTTSESHFSLFNNQVVVVSTRTVADLSPGEIARCITIVATIADAYDEALQQEFPSLSA